MKEDSYNPADLEIKALAYWEKNKSFEVNTDNKKEKYYSNSKNTLPGCFI